MVKKEIYNENELFTAMAENAFEFLIRALDEFEESPKFSIVHFATAIELFLKARLFKEHWSLITERLEKVKKNSFFDGETKTINMDTTMSRLKNIADDPVPEEANETFHLIAQHRNRILHFVHSTNNENEIPEVAAEQLHGWFLLHFLLSVQWKGYFYSFSDKISQVEYKMQKHRGYLKEKFKSKQNIISEHQKKGGITKHCNSCGFNSLIVKNLDGAVSEGDCLVCWYQGSVIKLNCPNDDCFQLIEFDSYEGPPEYCPSCKSPFQDAVPELLDTSPPITPKNYFDAIEINCSECSGYLSVVEHHNGYICTQCFYYSTDAACCEWCGQGQLGGVPEDSYYAGCGFCGGKASHES